MKSCVWLGLLCAASAAFSQTLSLPPRATNAPTGSELVQRLTPLTLEAREQEILAQVTAGNVPEFLRRLCPVTVTSVIGDKTNTATFFVTPDYLAVGSDADYFFTPLTPVIAQRIADFAGCALPTRKMVDSVHAAAEVRLAPAPIPPGQQMTTVPEFAKHDGIVKTQRATFLKSSPLGALGAGHKKDVVISAKLAESPGKVAIYGWHQTNGAPIQPLYLGHTATWVDYSHGIRLVSETVKVNNEARKLGEVLADPNLAGLLSDEGAFSFHRYETNQIRRSSASQPDVGFHAATTHFTLADFKPSPRFEEQTLSFAIEPGVKIQINAPSLTPTNREVLLVFYALPNGNTTEQTIGKLLKPGEDWHYDIQHIGAQTRWLRQRVPERPIVLAYLENSLKSWPAWRKQHGDAGIPAILNTVKRIFVDRSVKVVLTGHSGGGSLTFGYLNAVEAIPDDVERIAFLDSNYAYDGALHANKLIRWLSASDQHALCVLAYEDHVALLDGKTFVSQQGGTWGRSQAMLKDLAARIPFSHETSGGLRRHVGLGGHVQLLLKENPERKILHTVQVERNGFIHAMLAGTPHESDGYVYLGARAYGNWISPD